jgi:hypothetical protein
MVWGTRDSITMYRQLSFATSPPLSAFHTSMAGMETEPMSKFAISNPTNAAIANEPLFIYLSFL